MKTIRITAQKMKFSIMDFFSKCDQIRSFLRIWSHLVKKSLMENFIFCASYFSKKNNKNKFYEDIHKIHRNRLLLIYFFLTKVVDLPATLLVFFVSLKKLFKTSALWNTPERMLLYVSAFCPNSGTFKIEENLYNLYLFFTQCK